MTNYYVLELEMSDDVDEFEFELDEALDELEAELQSNGYDYLLTNDPYYNQLINLVVPAKSVNRKLDELIYSCGLTYTAR